MKRWIAELVDAKSKIGAISRGRGGHDARLNRRQKPLDGDYSLSRNGRRRVGSTSANDESFNTAMIKIGLGNGKELSKEGE
jgi:hypothetical protein